MTELMRLKEWQIFSRVFNCDGIALEVTVHKIDFVDKTTFSAKFSSST